MRRLALLACSCSALVTPLRRHPSSGLLQKQAPLHRPPAPAPLHRPPTALHAFDPAVVAAFDPAKFTPVCTASDAIYRGAQQSIAVIVGPKVFEEYAPLIAGGLLRVRLELCVVESFFGEAVLPFVQKNGLSWVLPFHETVETFLAGTIFALVLNFILVGSTKILQVVVTWFDFFLGMPSRFVSTKAIDQLSDEADESPKPAVVAFTVSKTAGEAIGLARQFVDALDVFTSQYLSLTTAAYITFKFLHFRVFD